MTTIEFKNSFHNTKVRVQVADEDFVRDEQNGNQVRLSKSQQRRVERALCGMADCCCAGHGNYRRPLTDGGWAEGGVEV